MIYDLRLMVWGASQVPKATPPVIRGSGGPLNEGLPKS
jgi:hypothetical protein